MPSSPTARDAAEGLAEQIERLRAASEAAPAGNAFTCGPPWFRHGSGVLVGSPDPHAGHLVADTDTSFLRNDEGPPPDWDDDAIAAFLSEAWNFARLILSRPDLITAFRSAGTEGGGTQGVGAGRALRDGLSPDGRTAKRSEPAAFDPARGPADDDANIQAYLIDLSEIGRNHGIGLAGDSRLFYLWLEDYAYNYSADADGVIRLGDEAQSER